MIAVGSSSGICSDSDDAGTRQDSQAWGCEMTCFHTSGVQYSLIVQKRLRSSLNYPHPIMHSAMT